MVEHWESYYRAGGLATCPMGLEPGYTREVREAWEQFFSGLADGSRVVDLGTGNGAIVLLAKQAALGRGLRFELHGIDLARIDPVRHVRQGDSLLEGIRFHPGVAAEVLPFESDSVDAVCGQYSLEYMDAPRVLDEAARVLRRAGRCRFVLHHAESVLVSTSVESLRHADYILEESHVLRRFRRFVERDREAPDRARGAWQDLVRAGAALKERAGKATNSVTLAFVNDSLRRLFEQRESMSATQVLAALDQIEAELRVSVRRLRDVVAGALTSDQVEALRVAGEASGLGRGSFGPQLFAGDKLVGWSLEFDRS